MLLKFVYKYKEEDIFLLYSPYNIKLNLLPCCLHSETKNKSIQKVVLQLHIVM
jgi:hypothetical protein